MFKKVVAVVMVVMFLFAFSGFTSKTTTQTSTKKAASNELYIEVTGLTAHPYFAEHKRGMEIAAKVLGVKTKFVGPADVNMQEIINTLEQSIAEKPKGIIVVGFGEELAPSINKAIAAGIPVVTADGDVVTSNRMTFVGTGNYGVGTVGGEALAKAINKKGKVLICSKVGQPNLEERVRGYKDTFAKYKDINVVQVVDTNSDNTVTASAVAAALQKNPDLAGIVTCDATGPGVVSALKEAGKKVGNVKVVLMDNTDDNLQLVKDGWALGIVAQRTALMAFTATQILYNYVHKLVQTTADDTKAKLLTVPKQVDTGTFFIDKNNVSLFLKKK
jgi:ribose transport system substrate-binding protein